MAVAAGARGGRPFGACAGHAACQSRVHSRNHRVEEALSAAVERGDYAPFETLLNILARPFDDQPEFPTLPNRRHKGLSATEPSAAPEEE